ALENRAGCLGRHVARSEPGTPGREDDVGRRGQLFDGGRDLVSLVRDDATVDLPAVGTQQVGKRVAASVLRLAARHAIGDGEHRGSQALTFSTSSTANVICLSIAFAMS